MENNIVENLLIIYSADEGKLKILLQKRNEEPYKDYWVIPNEILNTNKTLEDSSEFLFKKSTTLENGHFIQGSIFSKLDRSLNDRVIGITNIAITDKKLVDIKKSEKYEWFDVNQLPKIAFDHKTIIEEVTKEIKNKIRYNYRDILLDLFPSDFTLSEFQKFYENILEKTIDRRNFRKKILNQNLVIDTGEKTTSGTGRPGTLYRFNIENMKGTII